MVYGVISILNLMPRIKVGSDREQGRLRFNYKFSHKEVSLRIYIIKNHTPSAKRPPIIECCLRTRKKKREVSFFSPYLGVSNRTGKVPRSFTDRYHFLTGTEEYLLPQFDNLQLSLGCWLFPFICHSRDLCGFPPILRDVLLDFRC